MANTLYRAAVRELERLLSPRLASQSLHEGLAALGQSADTLRLADAETILRNRVLPRLTGSLGEAEARTTVEGVLGRLAEVAAAETRAHDLELQAEAVRELRTALKPFSLHFEWREVQELRAQLARIEAEHAAGRAAGEPIAAAQALLRVLTRKLDEQVAAQAAELTRLEAAHHDLSSLASPKLRRLAGLIDVIRTSQNDRQQAPAEVERAHALVAELRALQLRRADDEVQALRGLADTFADLLALEPDLADRLAALRVHAARSPLGDELRAFRAELRERQEALRRVLAAEFGAASGDERLEPLRSAALEALTKALPRAAEVRRLRDLLRGGPAPERLAAFHRLEADAEAYLETPGGAALGTFLAAARLELETTATLPDLTPGSALLKEAEAARQDTARGFAERLQAARNAAAPLALLNSDEALFLRWRLEAFPAESTQTTPQAEREASLREVEALIATLQTEADATRAVASGLLSGSGALDEALGVFDLFDAPASALPTPPTPAPTARLGEPYAPPYAAVQGWLERQLEHDYIAGLALFTENADTLTAGVLPTAAKTLGRAVRLARRRANALGGRLAQGTAASLAVETQGYTMLVFWPTRTRSLALITHAPTWRGAARQTVEDALPELTALLQTPVSN